MPTYAFHCVDHGEFDEMHAISSIPQATCCPECGAFAPRVFAPSAASVCIPLNMMASAEGSQSRQAAYLASDRHVKDRQDIERINERTHQLEQSKAANLHQSVERITEWKERAANGTGPADYNVFKSD